MAFGHKAILASFLLNVGLILTVLTFFYPNTLQATADFLFGQFQSNPQLRIWYLYGLLVGSAALLATIAIRSVGRNAVAAVEQG